MRWSELDTEPCPVARTLAVIGDRWTVLILRDALRGVTRFDGFQARLKCSRAITAERLADLVERGVLAKEAYQEHPPRHDYRLTEKGRALAPVLMLMAQWGEDWMPAENGYHVRRLHRACGCEFQPVIACSECEQPVRAGEVEHVDPMKGRDAAA